MVDKIDNANGINRLKGSALKRRMREKKITQGKFARLIKYESRVTISYWWKGQRWPEELEPVMETALELPGGFFARVGRGEKYEAALRQKDEDEQLRTEEEQEAHIGLDEILAGDRDEVRRLTLDHIKLMRKARFPEGRRSAGRN